MNYIIETIRISLSKMLKNFDIFEWINGIWTFLKMSISGNHGRKSRKKSEKMTSDHNALILKMQNSKVLLKKKFHFSKIV